MKLLPWPPLLVAVCLLGCAPEVGDPGDSEWVLSGLSERGAGVEATDVRQWSFDRDGDATATGVWFASAAESAQ